MLSLLIIVVICIFDSGFCGWIQFKIDDLDWIDGYGCIFSGNIGLFIDYLGSIFGNVVLGLFNVVLDLF